MEIYVPYSLAGQSEARLTEPDADWFIESAPNT